MPIKNIILCIVALGLVGAGMIYKYERRAARYEARQEAKAEKAALAENLRAAKDLAAFELDAFLGVAKHVTGPDATLKIRVETGNGSSEHIWVSDFTPTRFIGNKAIEFEGVFSNGPVNIPDMELGDAVAFSRFVIEDWGLVVEGRGYGFYSVRAFLPHMEPEEAAQLHAFLAPNPLPDDWEAVADTFAPAEQRIDPRDRFMAHLGNPPETWDTAMVQVSWVKIEKKSNGKTVGYAQATWVENITRLENGALRGTTVVDERFGQANADPDPIEFTEAKIIDWGFIEDGRGYGFAKLRKASGSQTPRQKEMLAGLFAQDLLPEGW